MPHTSKRQLLQHRTRLVMALATALTIPWSLMSGPQTSAAVPRQSSASASPSIVRVGDWLVDAQGRVVQLHGFNIVKKKAPFYAAAFGPDDAKLLKDEGFTVARIGFIWAGVEPTPGRYNDVYVNRILALNDLLARYGIRTLVDFHQDGWNDGAGGDGAPTWASIGGSSPTGPDNWQAFWDDLPARDGVGVQTHFIRSWRHVAAKLRASTGSDNVLGLDPLNEPVGGSASHCGIALLPCPAFESGALTRFYVRVIRDLRVDGDRHVIFPESVPDNGAAEPALGGFSDKQTAFNFHYYCLATLLEGVLGVPPNPSSVGCAQQTERGIGVNLSHARQLGVPAVYSEFSCTDDNGVNADSVDIAGAHFLSWMSWAYYVAAPDPVNCSAQGLLADESKPASEANAKQTKLDALSVPYASATAGIPGKYSFDRSTGTMTYSYLTSAPPHVRLVTNRTRLFVPRRHYPGGARISAVGARVVNVAQDWVDIVSLPGHASVTVTVRRR